MTSRFMIALVCTGILASACAAPPTGGDEVDAVSQSESLTTKQQDQLAQVRAATAKYHDVSVALAAGYVPVGDCAQGPTGAMGTHFINFPLFFAPPDPLAPAVLLYEPSSDGPKLVGVEYWAPVLVNGEPWWGDENSPPPPGSYNPAPELFGVPFDGPMAGHSPQEPWHYDLHVWLWRPNPDGMFSAWNPAVSCQ
jgi:hypothetical protein